MVPVMSPRELALSAFWSEHPLCWLYSIANGEWRDGQFHPATSWTVKQLIAFAETLPEPIITRIDKDQR
jgi:hypothetical protein